MRKKLLAVLAMLLVFRVLAHIPIPIGSPETLRQILDNLFTSAQTPQLLSFMDVLSGGALANFSIMLVGLGPYINASIIMQLLTKAIPQLEELSKDGEFGRKKINQYTRILTFPLAIIQSIGSIFLVRQAASQLGGLGDITANASIAQWILMVSVLTGGAMLLMWLGELITEQSIGNGISLVITVGIVSQLPSSFVTLINSIVDKDSGMKLLGVTLPFSQAGLIYFSIISISILIVTILVVKLNEARREVTINYAKRIQGNRTYGGVTTLLPIKLITAGVVPIIFAVAFLAVPNFIGQLMSTSDTTRWQQLGARLVTLFETPTQQTFLRPGWEPFVYPIVYFLLVVLFTYFYTSITFNTKEIAENLQKQGGFVADVRSGSQTEKYLGQIVSRLTLFGAVALGLLALMPIVAQAFLTTNVVAIGGTSILILVSVSLETLRQIESKALMVTYDQYEIPLPSEDKK